MRDAVLVIETSGRGGTVGLSVGGVVTQTALDPARRHNRDLAPAVAGLLAAAGLTPRDVTRVLVGHGPGSYTGLRVGITSAKVFAYATGCDLVAVPTFAVLAAQSDADTVDVIGDGLQGLVYAQRFARTAAGRHPVHELYLTPATGWAATLPAAGAVTGPAVGLFDAVIPAGNPRVPPAARSPTVAAMLAVGLPLPPTADLAGLEPLYLRPSSAEEQAARTATGG